MQLFTKEKGLVKGRSFYVTVELEQVAEYRTITVDKDLKHYRVLEKALKKKIDELKHLSLFKLKRDKYNIEEKYLKKLKLIMF